MSNKAVVRAKTFRRRGPKGPRGQDNSSNARPDGREYCASGVEKEILIERCTELHLDGMTYETIGRMIGYSHARAFQFVEEGMSRRRDLTDELAAQMRKVQIERVQRIYQAHAANIGSDKSAGIMLKALEREAKIAGTDAPDQIALAPPKPVEQYDFSRLTIERQNLLTELLAEALVDPLASTEPSPTEEPVMIEAVLLPPPTV